MALHCACFHQTSLIFIEQFSPERWCTGSWSPDKSFSDLYLLRRLTHLSRGHRVFYLQSLIPNKINPWPSKAVVAKTFKRGWAKRVPELIVFFVFLCDHTIFLVMRHTTVSRCVILSNLYVAEFPHLWNEDNKSDLVELSWGTNYKYILELNIGSLICVTYYFCSFIVLDLLFHIFIVSFCQSYIFHSFFF